MEPDLAVGSGQTTGKLATMEAMCSVGVLPPAPLSPLHRGASCTLAACGGPPPLTPALLHALESGPLGARMMKLLPPPQPLLLAAAPLAAVSKPGDGERGGTGAADCGASPCGEDGSRA